MIYDETGTAKLQFVTPAGLAERFGAEAVLGTYEPTYEEKGLAALMHVSTLQVTAGTVLGSRTTAALTLTGPDLEAWLSGLEPEEAAQLAGAGEELPQILEELLSKDSVPMRTISQRIPMQKRDGQWRFAVTEEMEKEWFG